MGGLVVLGVLLHRTGWREFATAFHRIGLPAFLAVTALGAIEFVIDCEALRRSMLGRVGLGWTMASNSAGGLVNTVVPFEAGELLKGALLRQRSTHSRVVSGLVIWNYVWKLAKPAAVATIFAGSVVLGHVYGRAFVWPVLVGVLLSFLPYFVLRLLLRQGPAERLMRLVGRLSRVPGLRGWRAVQNLNERAASGVQSAARLDGEVRNFWSHHPGAYLQVFGLTFVCRFIGVVGLYVLARRLGLPSDAGSLLFLYAAQTVADYFAMVVPARVGVNEGTAYLLFQTLGLDPTAALVMTITIRIRSLVYQGPLAIWAYLGGQRTDPKPAGALAETSSGRDHSP